VHLLLGLTLLAASHSESQSSSRVTVAGASATVELRCQALSLFEVLPQLDADRDGLLTAAELDDARDQVTGYISQHYLLNAAGSALSATVGVPQLVAPDRRTLFPEPQTVDLSMAFASPGPIESLVVEVTLFHDTSPDHRDLVRVDWNSEIPTAEILDRRRPRARWPLPARPRGPMGSAPPAARGAGRFLRIGVEHILGGWDHLAFLAALLLAARSFRSLFGVVTAFTISHSITLALASFAVVRVPGTTVEIAIALSIAYVGADNLLYPKARAKWPEAFLFGLIHGLGFASFIGESLMAESSKLWALLAFNLGVEVGQVSVVLIAALALRLLTRRAAVDAEPGLVGPGLRRAGSIVVTSLGLYWFVERAWL
jgi:hypothetical protein